MLCVVVMLHPELEHYARATPTLEAISHNDYVLNTGFLKLELNTNIGSYSRVQSSVMYELLILRRTFKNVRLRVPISRRTASKA